MLTTTASVTIGSRSGTCSRCHRTYAVAMTKTAHASVDCYSCHVNGAWDLPRQKLAEVFRMYPQALIGRGVTGFARQTSARTCLDCHGAIETKVSTGTSVRIDHKACAQEASCDSCHAATAHGSAVRWSTGPVMQRCIGCHEDKNVSTACELCHLKDGKASLNARGPWQVVHGPDWRRTHGMGDLSSCAACHPASTYNTTGFCAKCHGIDVPHPPDFGGKHGKLALGNLESCLACHDKRALCDACHQTEMPHPADFTRQHSSMARGEQDARCLRCHVGTDCTQCHGGHSHPSGAGVPVPRISVSGEGRPTT